MKFRGGSITANMTMKETNTIKMRCSEDSSRS